MSKEASVTISLPREMLKRIELVRRAENRSRSELVRDAINIYLARPLPHEPASRSEIAALKRARREYERGETITLADYLDAMEAGARQGRAKRHRSTAG